MPVQLVLGCGPLPLLWLSCDVSEAWANNKPAQTATLHPQSGPREEALRSEELHLGSQPASGEAALELCLLLPAGGLTVSWASKGVLFLWGAHGLLWSSALHTH